MAYIKYFLIIGLFINPLVIELLAVEQSQNTFQRAVNYYEERNYEQALEHFQVIENKNHYSFELFYNIANTHFRLNNLGLAILYYQRALRIQPNNKPVQANLDYALSLTKDKQTIQQYNPLIKFTLRIINSLSVNQWFIALFIVFLLIIAITNVIIIYFKDKDKTIPFFFLGLIVIIFLITASAVSYRWYFYSDKTKAVLIAPTANCYSGPGEDYTHLFSIHEGKVITILRKEHGWSQIKLSNDVTGWIPDDKLKLIAFDIDK